MLSSSCLQGPIPFLIHRLDGRLSLPGSGRDDQTPRGVRLAAKGGQYWRLSGG